MTSGAAGPDSNGLDASKPNIARLYDYLLGGKDNFAADREAAEKVIGYAPEIPRLARENRRFLGRVVRFLAAAGIRQFIDIGTGLPTADNTHEVAQRITPDARVVYADNDPLVLAHARALLVGTPEGATKYLHADIRDVDSLTTRATEILDFTEPVAVLILGVLGHIHDTDEARSLVTQIRARMPSGSYLAISDGTLDKERRKLERERAGDSAMRYRAREPVEIASFSDGLEWVEPGFCPVSLWRPDPSPDDPVSNVRPIRSPSSVGQYGGVARKP
jgi:hypothetical protein